MRQTSPSVEVMLVAELVPLEDISAETMDWADRTGIASRLPLLPWPIARENVTST
jgi:hypothetical protein